MSIYLIDFENVHYDGLSGILNLNDDDEVYIFYSDNGKRLTFELHEQIIQSNAKFYYYKAAVGGKNALDHQLSTYLGFLVGKKEEKQYYIVSKDQGFRHLIAFWKSANLGLEINLVDSIRISRQNQNGSLSEPTLAAVTPITETLEPVVPAVPKAKADTESPLSKLLTSRRKNRNTKAKPAAEKEVVAVEPSAATKQTPAESVPAQPQGQPLPQSEAQPAGKAEPMTMSRGFTTDSKHPHVGEKILPKVIEFVLPQEVMAAGKPGRSSAPAAEIKPAPPLTLLHSQPEEEDKASDSLPVVNSEAKPADKKEAEPTVQAAAQPTAEDKGKKTAKAQPARRSRAKKSEPAKQIKAEPAEAVKAKPVFHEEDIVKYVPEAAGQPWLGDVTRYLNNSSGKADLYNMIRRRLGQEEGRKIYNLLKKMI